MRGLIIIQWFFFFFFANPFKTHCHSCVSRASIVLDSRWRRQALCYNLLLLKTQERPPGAWQKCRLSGPIPDSTGDQYPHSSVSSTALVDLPQSVPLDLLKQSWAPVLFKPHKHAQPATDQYPSAVTVPRWGIRGKWRWGGFPRLYTEN